MNASDATQASDLLMKHWRAGTHLTALPDPLRPESRLQGYAIQAQHLRHSQHPLVGWKIAATSAAGQQHIAVDGPLAGRLLAEQVRPMGATLSLNGNRMRVAELEFAFKVGQTLPPRPVAYTPDEVMAAVASLHPAIEIPDSRFTDFTLVGAAQLIADNACAHEFLLGEGHRTGWQGLDLAAFVVSGWHRIHSGGVATSGGPAPTPLHGLGANVLGDPRLAMTWLVNELSQLGLPLERGQVVTTGTCVVPVPIQPGSEVFGDFGPLGTVTARFS